MDVDVRDWVDPPAWLDEENYVQKIQLPLRTIKVLEIAQALHVSGPYAAFIRSARRRPHPRHWQVLAELVGVLADVHGRPRQSN